MLGVRGVGFLDITEQREVITKNAPGIWQVRLQFDGAPQRDDRLVAAVRVRQRESQFELCNAPVGLASGERFEHVEGGESVALEPMRCAEHQRGSRVARCCREDLRGLLSREGRIGSKEARRVRERDIQRADLRWGARHSLVH